MTKAGKRLIGAAKEILAISRGEKTPAAVHVQADIDVKAIRSKLELSQDDFATEFGFTIAQIRHWEQGRSRPLGGLRAYLMLINEEPEKVRGMMRALRRSSEGARKAA